MLLRSLLMVSLLKFSVLQITFCFRVFIHRFKYSILSLLYGIKHNCMLSKSVVLLGKIMTVFSQLRLQAAQEIFLHLLERFSEYQL